MENNQDSLKRSHSKVSNTALTMLSILSSIVVSILCISVGFFYEYEFMKYVLIGSSILTVLMVFLFIKFKR